MSFAAKKIATFALASAAAALTAGCGGHGPNTYLMPKDAVMAKLSNSEKQFETIGGQMRTIRATGWSGDTLKVRLTMNSGNGQAQVCEALVEAVDEEWTRVSPSCIERGTAVGATVTEITEKEVDEFIIAVLHDTEIDGTMVAKRGAAVVIDNMPEMQSEAIAADKAYREAASRSQADSGWAEDSSGSDWGN